VQAPGFKVATGQLLNLDYGVGAREARLFS
jgi:hypothetical protein